MLFFKREVDYRKIVSGWLSLAVAITVLAAVILVTVQQDMRQSADDPQIQLSQDAARELSFGAAPASIVGLTKVDISKSLAPYMMIYSESGLIQASSAILPGGLPQVPLGALRASRSRDFYSVTWQPDPGVRSAIVVTHYAGQQSGFVVVGRSLREVEKRESLLELQVLLGWVVALVLSLGTTWAVKTRH